MGKLDLGKRLGSLGVKVIPGEPWTGAPARLRTRQTNGSYVVTAWPEPPVLVFPEPDFSVTAVLSADPDSTTADSVATFSLTVEQVDLLKTGMDCKVQLFGESVWMGEVLCQY